MYTVEVLEYTLKIQAFGKKEKKRQRTSIFCFILTVKLGELTLLTVGAVKSVEKTDKVLPENSRSIVIRRDLAYRQKSGQRVSIQYTTSIMS